jgi:hypothetical protein
MTGNGRTYSTIVKPVVVGDTNAVDAIEVLSWPGLQLDEIVETFRSTLLHPLKMTFGHSPL